MLPDREQARPQVALGRQPDSIADFAKSITDRGDDADPTLAAVAKTKPRGGRGPLIGRRLERELAVDRLDDVAAGDDALHRPDAAGIQGHELDATDFTTLPTRQGGG